MGSPLIGAGVTPVCAGAKALSGMVEIASFEPELPTVVPLVRFARHARGDAAWPGKRGGVDRRRRRRPVAAVARSPASR